MKKAIHNFLESEMYKKHEKLIKRLFILFVFVLVGGIVWFGFLGNLVKFYNTEKQMKKATETYFDRNLDLRPKEVGGVSTVSLKTFQEIGLMEKVYVPGRNKLCSLDNSWGKVKKTDKGYEYYVYLECGKYRSNVDHEGPVITLNGKDSIILEYGQTYKEQGVKDVTDKKDGSIDKKNVQIVGKVNSNKVGTYNIKYVVFDSLRNKTIKYRKIKVTKTLHYIAEQDNKDGIYKGRAENNYVWYSGALWRIVKTNSDGTTKLVTNDSLANISYSSGMSKDGYVYNWLNEYYYSLMYKPSKFVKDSKWCNDETNNGSDKSTNCKNEVSAKVGLITLSEYNQSIDAGDTYLNNGMTFWTMTRTSDKRVYGVHNTYDMSTHESKTYNGVRPSINIKANVSVSSGTGSSSNPYVLEEYKYGKSGKLLSTRHAGEYIKYSGHLWRIQGVDADKNIKIVMNGVLNNGKGGFVRVGYGEAYDNKPKKYGVNNKDNIGYKLNHELKDYLITKKFVEGTYEVDFYKNGLKNTKAKNSKITSLLSIPDVTEAFVLGTASYANHSFFIRNTLDSNNEILMVNGINQTEEFYSFVFENSSIKVQTLLNKDVKIKGGIGTYDNPYELR